MLNRRQQSSLIAVLRDAMNRLGLTQKELASRIGTSAGTLSAAFSLKGQMRDDRWRMCCETCGVDFDRFMDFQQHEAGQRPTNDSECLHSPSVASAGPAPVMAEPEQTEPEEKEVAPVKNPVTLTEDEVYTLEAYLVKSLPEVIASEPDAWTFVDVEQMIDLRRKLQEMRHAMETPVTQ